MGNYISCTVSHSAFKNCRGTKVILPNGDIQQFDSSIKAAELMFDTPNYFIVNIKSLKIGMRFFALNADEDLEISNVYAMFQMKRLNSLVTAADMGPLLVTANYSNKRGVARVAPETMNMIAMAATTPEPRLELNDAEELNVGEFRYRLSMCRSKKPVLETIIEEH